MMIERFGPLFVTFFRPKNGAPARINMLLFLTSLWFAWDTILIKFANSIANSFADWFYYYSSTITILLQIVIYNDSTDPKLV